MGVVFCCRGEGGGQEIVGFGDASSAVRGNVVFPPSTHAMLLFIPFQKGPVGRAVIRRSHSKSLSFSRTVICSTLCSFLL